MKSQPDTLQAFMGEVSAYERAVRESAKAVLTKDHTIYWSPKDRSRPVVIAGLADMHIGCSGVDYDALDRACDIIVNTPDVYLFLGGDGIDNHIKHIAAMVASSMNPGEQWEWFARVLNKLAHKILCIVSGNHEAWTVAMTGYDPLKPIAKTLMKPYRRDDALVEIKLSKITYKMFIRHKFRFNSSENPEHAVRRMWTYGPCDFDIGVVCHNHDMTVAPFVRHGKKKWIMRPGTFQLESGFAKQHGYYNAVANTPAVMLMPDEHNFHAFDEVQWAIWALRGSRK